MEILDIYKLQCDCVHFFYCSTLREHGTNDAKCQCNQRKRLNIHYASNSTWTSETKLCLGEL